MKNLNIEKINKKMSIFIGGKYIELENRWKFKCMEQSCGSSVPDFHNDWNWLNKIIDKIETHDYMFIIIGFQSKIIYDYDLIKKDLADIIPICENNGNNSKTKIESVYKTCNDFIEYYNNNINI